MNWFDDVLDFHERFGLFIGDTPKFPDGDTRLFRRNLIEEEVYELFCSEVDGDLAGVADAIADIIYVAIGMAISYGIPLKAVWNAVQAANMAKVGGGTRKDGKILKPPGWTAPDIAKVLQENRIARVCKACGGSGKVDTYCGHLGNIPFCCSACGGIGTVLAQAVLLEDTPDSECDTL